MTWTDACDDRKLHRLKTNRLKSCQKEDLYVVQSTTELVAYLNAHHVPFLVQHQRIVKERKFIGLVTKALDHNNSLNFKVLYPYDASATDNLSYATLYKFVSTASCAMYSDYNSIVSEPGKDPRVTKANSNGWEHLLVQIPCASGSAQGHNHLPYAYCTHLQEVFPSKLRSALKTGIPCEINLQLLPPKLHVTHTLELDHLLEKRVTRKKAKALALAEATSQLAEATSQEPEKAVQHHDGADVVAPSGVIPCGKQVNVYEMAEAVHAVTNGWLSSQGYSDASRQRFFEVMARRPVDRDHRSTIVRRVRQRMEALGNLFVELAAQPVLKRKREPKVKREPHSEDGGSKECSNNDDSEDTEPSSGWDTEEDTTATA